MFDREHGIALQPMPGIRPHLAARGKSHTFSRVVAGTWGIFSIKRGDGQSKLEFVQRLQDAYLITTYTSGT